MQFKIKENTITYIVYPVKRRKQILEANKMIKVEIKRDFKVLREIISPQNIQVMAELITIKQTKKLIDYIGENAITAHSRVYYDVMRKAEDGYVLSDYYDLVQDVAVFLCEHFGEYLDDYLYTSKKGKAVTVKMECYYIIKRELYRRYYVNGKNRSLESYRFFKDRKDFIGTSDEEIEESYERAEKIITLMNLSEKHLVVLNARLNGVPYTQIAAILHCTTGGVHGFR